MKKKSIAFLLVLNMVACPAVTPAAPTIPGLYGTVKNLTPPLPNQLPVPGNPSNPNYVLPAGVTINNPSQNLLVINQINQQSVAIDWKSFDIGSNATVRFYQGTGTPGTSNWTPNSGYAALNRIYGQNPSQIYGKLIADGKVYLINQNGILFGAGSQVNTHALVASALNFNISASNMINGLITDDNFNKGDLFFTTDDYTGQGSTLSQDTAIWNSGTITTDSGGFVALVGPQVYNEGTISSPSGKIRLIGVSLGAPGGTNVEFMQYLDLSRSNSDVVYNVNAPPNAQSGIVTNAAAGSLVADSGQVGMYGYAVNQNGLVRSVSAVKVPGSGQIFLYASNKVTTGPGSLTTAPVSDSAEKIDTSFSYSGGHVTISGIYAGGYGGSDSQVSQLPLQNIEHDGSIVVPTGTVELYASNRVYLESGSSIDVGGVWVDEPASAGLITAQLNSVNLADSYLQKNGILKGTNITTTVQNGTNIGNISGSYTSADMSAAERSTTGGSIVIGGSGTVPEEVIVRQGATLDFSGGGYLYAAGTGVTTKLLSGNKVYDIGSAPGSLSYQAILGSQTVTHQRFGISENFMGYYTGGGTPLYAYVPARTVGSNAGSLAIDARTTVLDGTLNGSVTRGQYQTQFTDPTADNGNDYKISVAMGLEEPVGGTLTIGNSQTPPTAGNAAAYQTDFGAGSIVVSDRVTPLTDFSPGDSLKRTQTEISASMLSSAGLSKLNLYANNSITINAGADISLLPSGSYTNAAGARFFSSAFTAKSRRIEDSGVINVPDGSVEMTLQDNASEFASLNGTQNPLYVPVSSLVGGILVDNGSRVNVAGETVDNSMAGTVSGSGVKFGHVTGGSITIQDNTVYGTTDGNSVIVRSGAVLDVSGGYTISTGGKVTGGDAGSLTLRGDTLSVAGDLRGFSLPGCKGGAITLHAGDVIVAAQPADLPDSLSLDDAVPDGLKGKLVLSPDRLASTGFSRIELDAIHDVDFEDAVTMAPSTVKSASPTTGASAVNTSYPVIQTASGLVPSPDYTGPTSVAVNAGVNINNGNDLNDIAMMNDLSARISVPAGSGIRVIPGGSIALKAPYMEMDGALEAPGGNISVTAGTSDLDIGAGARILAGGYNKPSTRTVAGLPAGPSPQAGGSVALTSTNGSIILENGSLVDVSGSPATQVLTTDADGTPVPVTTAAGSGSLALTYANSLSINGEINGRPALAGVQGGTLTVYRNTGVLSISSDDFNRYGQAGFDSMTFRSASAVNLQGSMDISVGRSLVFDAPSITGGNSDTIRLSAPWVQLNNSSSSPSPPPGPFSAANNTAQLTLSGGWLDVNGSVLLSGFSDVFLQAGQDIRLTDANYNLGVPGAVNYHGDLSTPGNLTLQAARIYPTTASVFNITAGGKFTTLPGAAANPADIFSAGGSLTINAAGGIEHRGVLAAPMGSITLNSGNGRIYLADGSLITTGTGAAVAYGTFDGTSWYIGDKNDTGNSQVTAAPGKSITISGNEVVVMSGSQLDVSGGGSVFSYLYQADVEGTTNPISTVGVSALTNQVTRSNRYVILPDNSVQLPGFTYTDASGKTKVAGAVYLSGIMLDDGTYLKAGTYSLLPEQFAFVPGALVISDIGKTVAAGATLRTSDGYQVVGGYSTFMGTGIQSPVLEGYSVRLASDVLKEGNFTVNTLSAGNAGGITITGNTTVMAGAVKAAALPGYTAGSLTMSGKTINVQEAVTGLDDTFGFATPIPSGMAGQLLIAASTLSGYGLGTLTLGNAGTDSVTISQGSDLVTPNITLYANNRVTVESGARIDAVGNNGSVTISTPGGILDVQANAVVHATDAINLTISDVNLDGDLVSDHGIMNLAASRIYFVSDTYTRNSAGLYLTSALQNRLAGYAELSLTSGGDITFLNDVNLTVANALTLDAQSFSGPADVSITAGTIQLKNSSGNMGYVASESATGSLALNAGNISVSLNSQSSPAAGLNAGVSSGDIVFNGFRTVSLNSAADLTLGGVGSVKTAGDLNLTAARVTTTYYKDAGTSYRAANFLVEAGGDVNIYGSGGAAGSSVTPGGTLAISGGGITQHGGLVEVASGQVALTATTGDITLENGARIWAKGTKQANAGTAVTGEYDYSPGGKITLNSSNGAINLQAGSELNVSASDQGDAGAISLSAPTGGVATVGTLAGGASSGYEGGSFTIDTNALDISGGVNGFSALNDLLSAGGFTGSLNIRARNGNLTVATADTVTARGIALEADGYDGTGNIYINGSITALPDAGGNGGRVEISAQNGLTVNGNISAISSQASGSTASGGYVYLNTENGGGYLTIAPTAFIDVSGGPSTGGTVYLRAQRNNANGVNMALSGRIAGASGIVAEAFAVYSPADGQTIQSTDMVSWLASASTYMNNAGNIVSGLLPVNWNPAAFHFRPGIEVQGNDKVNGLTLSSPLDLTGYRYANNEPGVLTLRSSGDLNVKVNLVDHPTKYSSLHGDTMQNTWEFNMTAGADLNAANPLAVNAGTGNLTIGSGSSVVYTENAPINFAAGNNVTVNKGTAAGYMLAALNSTTNPSSTSIKQSSMLYTLASYGGAIRGVVGNDLLFNNGGVIQSATGNIDIEVGGNLELYDSHTLGAIRTTGEYSKGEITDVAVGDSTTAHQAQMSDYWTYRNGGDIRLDVNGDVAGNVNIQSTDGSGLKNAWDYTYGGGSLSNPKDKHLAASFEGANSTEGIATMGGGNIRVRTGGAFNSQTGAFGTEDQGDLTIITGGDLKGRFRVMNGTASLTSGGRFGDGNDGQVVELAKADFRVRAQGDIYLGAIMDPDITRQNLFFGGANGKWNLQYGYKNSSDQTSADTRVYFSSLTGNLTLSGVDGFDGYPTGGDIGTGITYGPRQLLLPPSVALLAAGDINIQNAFYMTPSPTGNLQLFASGSINGGYTNDNQTNFAKIIMSDKSPDTFYGYQSVTPDFSSDQAQDKVAVHQGDSTPVEVFAGQDIENLQLYLPKLAEISARGDIRNLVYVGQNVGPKDLTTITAGVDIAYNLGRTSSDSYTLGGNSLNVTPGDGGIRQDGPGMLVVQAGRNIDLGFSAGIQSVDYQDNVSFLGGPGCNIIVAAGAKKNFLVSADAAAVADFFNGADGLQQAGAEYSNLLAAGKTAEAQQRINQARDSVIRPLFDVPAADGSGSLNMTQSQISATNGNGNVYILARGAMNVGRSVLSNNTDLGFTGIYTSGGGTVNIYSGGDVNVNESRVMTFMGGDITIWSDTGNINAGRGSRTAVSPGKQETIYDSTGAPIATVYKPPAVGSGIRAVTSDPNTEPGNLYVFAPQGVIDAGEAGIAGGKVILGATQVLNAQNISFSAGSVGVPSGSESSFSLGSISGAGAVADATKSVERSVLGGDNSDMTRKLADKLAQQLAGWLDVKVIGFDSGTSDAGQ